MKYLVLPLPISGMKGNDPIAGATAATYPANAEGTYKVKAYPSGGCVMTSSETKLNPRSTTGLLTIGGGETQVKCTGHTVTLTSQLQNSSLTGTYNGIKMVPRLLVRPPLLIPLPILEATTLLLPKRVAA